MKCKRLLLCDSKVILITFNHYLFYIFSPLQTINTMANNGTEGNMISRTVARDLLDNYINSPAFPANNHTEGVLFGRDHITNILAQSGCIGIRIYYGKLGPLSTDSSQMVVVGTDSEGNDIPGLILDTGYPCPNHCSTVKL